MNEQAWQGYRTTRCHVSAEKADASLSELEMGNDIKPPKCHRIDSELVIILAVRHQKEVGY